MQQLGYGPDKRLASRCRRACRRLSPRRGDHDLAIAGDLHRRPARADRDRQLYPRVTRKDYTVGSRSARAVSNEPDQKFYETYVCGAERIIAAYCNDETDRLIDRQSDGANAEKRRDLVWGGRAPTGAKTRLGQYCCILDCYLHAAAAQGPDDDDQQPLQRLRIRKDFCSTDKPLRPVRPHAGAGLPR